MSSRGFSSLFGSFLTFLFILLTGSGNILLGQSFDHQEYPRLDFDFISLQLDLGIQPQNLRIDGAARYEVEANISGADTLTMDASHIDIKAVLVDDKSANYSLQNDSLFISVDDSTEVGQRYMLNIRYSGRPQFGLLKNSNGTVWTSQLPKAQRHWAPIVDNPHVELKTTFNIAVPSGLQVWASGKKTDEKAVSVDVMRYQFTSNKPIPASSLSFVVGNFVSQSTSYGIKKINLAVEKSIADTTNTQALLQEAYDLLGAVEDRVGLEYPYEQLNVVLLEDHNWEAKTWGASTIFLYKNGGDLESQLLRGIIGQWFGVYQREALWSQADAILLYQTIVASDIMEQPATVAQDDRPQKSFSTVYDIFGAKRWNQWQQGIARWQEESTRSLIAGFVTEIVSEMPSVIYWHNYGEFWYRKMGQPFFDLPELEQISDTVTTQQSDSVFYRVDYLLNEAEGQLKLRFESQDGVYSDLTSLRAYEVYADRVDTSDVTFTGATDSVIVKVDPMIETLRLQTTGEAKLKLDEFKPASFLINEFQHGETVSQRTEAARKLGHHSDNPDLQLAIRDFMNKELEPEVKAALISSFADITNGASGTEQVFVDALRSDQPKIRTAGLLGLQNFKNNAQILNIVESLALNTEEFSVFKKSTKVLTTIASEEEFTSFVETVTQQDTTGTRSIFAIQELANIGKVEDAVANASLFTGDQYPYEIRSRALGILIQHDHAPADWLSRAEGLLEEADPRIRFLTVEGLERNLNSEVTAFLSEQIQDEYDARVYRKMAYVIGEK